MPFPFPLSPAASWALLAGLALVLVAVAVLFWPRRAPRLLVDELRAAGYVVVERAEPLTPEEVFAIKREWRARYPRRRPFDWQQDDPLAAG